MERNESADVQLLKGGPVATKMDADTAGRTERLKAKGVFPTLAVVRFGEREDDLSYERSLIWKADKLGIGVKSVVMPADTAEETAARTVRELSDDPGVHGILVFRPLPPRIREESISAVMDPEKDVDGMTAGALGGVFRDRPDGFPPCTAQAVMEICRFYGIELSGKRVAVAGRSLTVGKPLAMLMLRQNATVTVCHSRTRDLPSVLREADVVAAAIGKPALLGKDCFHPGQAVLDVGIHVTADGGMTGDVDFPEASRIVSAITPVPGGVGSVTTAVLMRNVVTAAEG